MKVLHTKIDYKKNLSYRKTSFLSMCYKYDAVDFSHGTLVLSLKH